MNPYRVYVHGAGDERLAGRLSEVTGLATADARNALASRVPRRVSDYPAAGTAEAEAAALRAAGLSAFVVDAAALAAFRPLEIRGAAFGDRVVDFRPAGRLEAGALRVVVLGRFTTSLETRSELTMRDPRRGYRRMLQGGGEVRRSESEGFAHLYLADGSAFELRANRFDFRSLGALAPTRSENLRLFVDRLRAMSPGAVVDAGLEDQPLPAREDEDFSSDGTFSADLTTRATRSSTEDRARRASYLIARALVQGC